MVSSVILSGVSMCRQKSVDYDTPIISRDTDTRIRVQKHTYMYSNRNINIVVQF